VIALGDRRIIWRDDRSDRPSEHGNAVARSRLTFRGWFIAAILLSVSLYAFHAKAQTTAYRVYFDWDSAILSSQAHQVIREAAYAARTSYARITVNGFTDTSGTASYNQGLSLRRAQVVAAELERDGVPQAAISIQAYGGHYLPTPTSLNVRAPQNRSVDIVVQAPMPPIVAARPPLPAPLPYAFFPPGYGYWGWGWHPSYYSPSDANDLR
jgi:outer membrane protein OmpA-like peptidoglycan-associated protein